MKKQSDLDMRVRQSLIRCSITEFPFVNDRISTVEGYKDVSIAVKKQLSKRGATITEAIRKVESDLSKEIRFIKCPQTGDLIKVFWGDSEFAFGKVVSVQMEEAYDIDDEDWILADVLKEEREFKPKKKLMKQFVTLVPCDKFKSPDFYFKSSRCHWTKMPKREIK